MVINYWWNRYTVCLPRTLGKMKENRIKIETF
uniref:Uncharacterized protein n=1 Tax=Rhizophora mucronata TaxID=61149 RepID=A0A2P2N6Z7_RHIMU